MASWARALVPQEGGPEFLGGPGHAHLPVPSSTQCWVSGGIGGLLGLAGCLPSSSSVRDHLKRLRWRAIGQRTPSPLLASAWERVGTGVTGTHTQTNSQDLSELSSTAAEQRRGMDEADTFPSSRGSYHPRTGCPERSRPSGVHGPASRMAKSITGAQGEDCRQGPLWGQERQTCQKPAMTCLYVISGTESGTNCTGMLATLKLSAHQDPPMGHQGRFQGTFSGRGKPGSSTGLQAGR